jgi:Tol biopolymer transport system component
LLIESIDESFQGTAPGTSPSSQPRQAPRFIEAWVRLTHNRASDGDPACSPGGRKVAFDRRIGHREPQIYVMNADGSHQQQLTK